MLNSSRNDDNVKKDDSSLSLSRSNCKIKLARTLVSFTAYVIVDDNDHTEYSICECVRSMAFVVVIEIVASNRKSKKKDGWMNVRRQTNYRT